MSQSTQERGTITQGVVFAKRESQKEKNGEGVMEMFKVRMAAHFPKRRTHTQSKAVVRIWRDLFLLRTDKCMRAETVPLVASVWREVIGIEWLIAMVFLVGVMKMA